MAIVNRSRRRTGVSANRPVYQASFLRDAHRLLARGYARMTAASYSSTIEEVVTEELVSAMKAAIEAPGAEAWMHRYEVTDNLPVLHPKRRGKKRPRVDIEIVHVRAGPRPRMHFEAKRLGRRHAVGGYVGSEGLGCILVADYARDHDHAGMIGYVQSESCDEWAQKIERKLIQGRRAYRLVTGTDWQVASVTTELDDVYLTSHERPNVGRAVVVYHTLLRFW